MGWKFEKNEAIDYGFNDAGIDIFAGAKSVSLVREVLQNSLDAQANPDEPVRVVFKALLAKRGLFPDADTFNEHLLACEEKERGSENQKPRNFYKNALTSLTREEIPFLCISDFGTTGLRNEQWHSLIRSRGQSFKQSRAAGGSYGHGQNAPFVMSRLRTVFYYTFPDQGEEKFIGKTILQSHPDPATGQQNGPIGFYCHNQVEAFAGTDISKDMRRLIRMGRGDQTDVGTSIFIPCPGIDLNDGERFKQITATLMAYFYYSISSAKLNIEIQKTNDSTISLNQNSIEGHFNSIKQQTKIVKELKIETEFATNETIIAPDFGPAELDIDNFGKVKYFLRLTDDGAKSASIARQQGMLITSKPPNLERFRGEYKGFHAFFCVTGEKGSELLRSLEDPQHKEFQFDRIEDKHERREAQNKYNEFSSELRKIIDNHAKIEIGDETELPADLQDFFRDFAQPLNEGRADEGFVASDAVARLIHHPRPRNQEPWDAGMYTKGDEREGLGGTGQGKGQGGSGNGSIPAVRRVGGERIRNTPSRPLAKLRRRNIGNKNFILHFDAPDSDKFDIQLFKVGESDSRADRDALKWRLKGKGEFRESLVVERQSDRMNLEVETQEDVQNYVIEGVAVKPKNHAE